ncbi:MAG TPA: efflux RND transporter periplasmic adaptor subunit [Terriglobales bacterium]|nr:efflux RND transporter periplasmic adaptor subunit [Terriglobales bacterium]
MKRKNFYAVLFVVAAILCVARWLRSSPKSVKAEPATESSLQPVAVAMVKRTSLVNSITLSGAFRPYQQVDVHAKVAGYIRRIFVDVGDQVKTGQELAILEVPELNAQVLGARADVDRYQSAIHRAEGDLQSAQSNHSANHAAYTRLKQAAESRPGLIAEQELDDSQAKDKEMEAQTASAQAALEESQSQLTAARANLARLSALESYARITAPFSGVITKRYADTGALIQAGTASDTQSLPVVELAEWARLRLVVPVPESAVSEIHLGSVVQVRVSALGRTFQGKVARFADSLDQKTRTMQVEIDVENRNGTLVGGMYAETDLTLKESDNTLTVPIQAIDRSGNGSATVLLIDRNGRVQSREIQIGEEGSDRVEVRSGLSDKDEVVVGNRNGVRQGERVRPRLVDDRMRNAEAGF